MLKGLDKIIGFDTYEGDPYNTGAAAYYGAEGIRAYIPKDHPYLKRDMRSKKIQILRPVQSFLKRLLLTDQTERTVSENTEE